MSLALLGADRSLSISEVLATVRPLASYIAARNWTVAGAADLTNRSTIRWTLHQLVASGVVSVYDAGTEPVWGIGAEQHLVAAFYRNAAIHIVVDRAIAETALLAAVEDAEASVEGLVQPTAVRDEALRLRELLKFEFLFSARAQFEKELTDEVRLIGRVDDTRKAAHAADVRGLLEKADVLLAHLVLRPFLDAYHIVADRLAAYDDESFDEDAFLAECPRWASNGSCSAGSPAPSRGRWSCSRRRCDWPGIASWSTASTGRTSHDAGVSSPTRSPPRSGASTPSRSWPGPADHSSTGRAGSRTINVWSR